MLGSWAVVVAQLVERSLPIPEIWGSKPVIGNVIYFQLLIKNMLDPMVFGWHDLNS